MGLFQAYGQAWSYFGDPSFLLFMLLGTAGGIIIGIIPGLSAVVLNSVFLAFVFFMPPALALSFMVAAHAVSSTGGAVTTILLGVPGSAANTATLLDGYTMTKKGQPGRALGLALAASGMGNIYSCFLALAMVMIIVPLIMAIASPEMVFLILLGIALISTLSEGSIIKGVIGGLLGILMSFIGYNLVTGMDRFSFGNLYLRDGLPLVPVFIGLFAIPETWSWAVGGSQTSSTIVKTKLKDIIDGCKELFRYPALNFISSVIGYIIGVIPGVGALVASWVAYGQANQTSKHRERFGTGIPEGIIAPESANNASGGGSTLTTLVLGIPGSEGCTVILAAAIVTGLVPGPEMVRSGLPLTLALLLVVGVTGIIASVVCILASPYLARFATLPSNIMVPLVITLVVVGVYVSRTNYADIVVLFVFGLLGLGMKQLGFNRPTFVLGLILGSLFEQYFFLSVRAYGFTFFLRPISIIIILLTVVLFSFRSFTKALKPEMKKDELVGLNK